MESLLAVAAILLVASLTPGPNNFMVMAAGARGGLAAAGPIIAGVIVGGLSLLGLAWGGVAAAIVVEPRLRWLAAGVGAAYLARLGGVMIRESFRVAGPETASGRSPVRMGWLGVALFQVLNPKAWVLLVSASAAMSRDFGGVAGLLALAGIYALRSVISLTLWALAGSALQRGLSRPGSQRWVERVLGTLLVVCAFVLVRVTWGGGFELEG